MYPLLSGRKEYLEALAEAMAERTLTDAIAKRQHETNQYLNKLRAFPMRKLRALLPHERPRSYQTAMIRLKAYFLFTTFNEKLKTIQEYLRMPLPAREIQMIVKAIGLSLHTRDAELLEDKRHQEEEWLARHVAHFDVIASRESPLLQVEEAPGAEIEGTPAPQENTLVTLKEQVLTSRRAPGSVSERRRLNRAAKKVSTPSANLPASSLRIRHVKPLTARGSPARLRAVSSVPRPRPSPLTDISSSSQEPRRSHPVSGGDSNTVVSSVVTTPKGRQGTSAPQSKATAKKAAGKARSKKALVKSNGAQPESDGSSSSPEKNNKILTNKKKANTTKQHKGGSAKEKQI